MFVEAAIDFPEEEIDFVSDSKIIDSIASIEQQLEAILHQAKSGAVLNEGLTVAIVGKPNAGKSSLLNALAADDVAIVTDQAGTTRDVLKEKIVLGDIPLTLIDTAGLRQSDDVIEQEGIRRISRATRTADIVLYIHDINTDGINIEHGEIRALIDAYGVELNENALVIAVKNKIDLLGAPDARIADNTTAPSAENPVPEIMVSAKQGLGLEQIADVIKHHHGIDNTTENSFTARSRHVEQLQIALRILLQGKEQLITNQAGELLAEDLRQVQNALGQITGAVTPDDLLGEIFSSFCIGK